MIKFDPFAISIICSFWRMELKDLEENFMVKKQVLLEISQPQAFSRQSHLVVTVMEEPFLRITIVGQNLSGVLQYMVSLETINTIM